MVLLYGIHYWKCVGSARLGYAGNLFASSERSVIHSRKLLSFDRPFGNKAVALRPAF